MKKIGGKRWLDTVKNGRRGEIGCIIKDFNGTKGLISSFIKGE